MNTKIKHTPGPWNLSKSVKSGYNIRDKFDNTAIARIYANNEFVTGNARLIATAPELLEVAKETLRQLNAPDCPKIPDGAMVRGRLFSAIAKAEGTEVK